MKLTTSVLVIGLILTLSACDNAIFDTAVRKEVRTNLKDPDSAKWGEQVVYKTRACLVVNSKNSYGGYTGNQTAWLENISSTGGEHWFLHGIDERPCYEDPLKEQVEGDAAEAALEVKLVTALIAKGYKIPGKTLPIIKVDDPTVDKCLLLANRTMASFRLSNDKSMEKERADWKKRAEQGVVTLESGKCEL